MAEPGRSEVKSASLTCEECGRAWVTNNERWRLCLTDDNPPLGGRLPRYHALVHGVVEADHLAGYLSSWRAAER